MTTFRGLGRWPKGANNMAPANALPDGFVRHAVNVDPVAGGILAARAGYEKIYAGSAVRGVLALGDKLLIADGPELVEVNTTTGSVRVVRSIAPTGGFVGDVLNDTLYFCTENECLEYDGQSIKGWGVPDVFYQPTVAVGSGGLRAGLYQLAVTYTDQWGREGGTDKPLIISCVEGSSITVTVSALPAGCTANVYVSSVDGSDMYLQATRATAGNVVVDNVRDDTATCETVLYRAPQPAQHVKVHNGVILLATSNRVEYTLPMQAHLIDRRKNYFQYPAEIGDVISDDVTVFVSADKCYALRQLETASVEQSVVLEFPAIPGTSVKLPDGRVAWMTRYGQAISDGATLDLINRESFAPSVADAGSAGVVDNNGNQLIVTTTRGKQTGNQVAASDFYLGEILNP
jgi:hypothetical protein